MTIYEIKEYNMMHLHQKAVILEETAVFLDHDLSHGILYTLFFYHTYFIEVMVEHESNNLLEIVAFYNGSRLDKYLDQVNLEDLI